MIFFLIVLYFAGVGSVSGEVFNCPDEVCVTSTKREVSCNQPWLLTERCVCSHTCQFYPEFDTMCTELKCHNKTSSTTTTTTEKTTTSQPEPQPPMTTLNQALIALIIILLVGLCCGALCGPKLVRYLKRNDYMSADGIPYAEQAIDGEDEDGIPLHPFSRAPLLHNYRR